MTTPPKEMKLSRLLAAATPGPWIVHHSDIESGAFCIEGPMVREAGKRSIPIVAEFAREEDADLIAALRNEAAVDCVPEERFDRAVELMTSAQWSAIDGFTCPWCSRTHVHAIDCPAALVCGWTRGDR